LEANREEERYSLRDPISQNNQRKMDWRYSSSGRAPEALHASMKPSVSQKEKRKGKNNQ
jgi:hypothetical protein